jgi:hypothetical protein
VHTSFPRMLQEEMLDGLPENDPRAIRSRRDLQRLNRIMGSAGIISEALKRSQRIPKRIVEIGTGDGSLMLALTKRFAADWPDVQITLLDRLNLVSNATVEEFNRLNWTVEILQADVLEWAESPMTRQWDIGLANLFIHHFDSMQIQSLFAALGQRIDLFVACEPRRSRLPLFASKLVGLIGANAVTRKDAVLSVQAGFYGQELSALWPSDGARWNLEESAARLFSHRFLARREAG